MPVALFNSISNADDIDGDRKDESYYSSGFIHTERIRMFGGAGMPGKFTFKTIKDSADKILRVPADITNLLDARKLFCC